ncbi:MAG: tyrosine-protein phosphatase [Proteobacteria bacterium]|nr:tyrosine-protein phosphatase [Pseudomonadota bacterium]
MDIDHRQRILRFDGARNVRDLGGLPTVHGTNTRHGVIIRADGLSRLTDDDLARLAALRLRTIVDLRFEEERQRAPDRVPSDQPPGFFLRGFYPNGTEDLFHAINVRGVGPDEAAAMMCANYARMPFDHAAEFRDIMHHIIADGTAPHLVHCASGKDRTGLLVAFVLLAVGVPLDVVFEDYHLSNGDWQPLDMFAPAARQDTIAAVMAAPREYLQSGLDAIAERCGDMDTYLEQWLGFGTREKDALARLMLE